MIVKLVLKHYLLLTFFHNTKQHATHPLCFNPGSLLMSLKLAQPSVPDEEKLVGRLEVEAALELPNSAQLVVVVVSSETGTADILGRVDEHPHQVDELLSVDGWTMSIGTSSNLAQSDNKVTTISISRMTNVA